jgi:diguanylate cyclase (GGDEF)-like protein
MGQPAQLGVVITMFAAILLADYVTGVELALRALYVVPVAVASWFLGRRAGILVALMGAGACVLFDYRGGIADAHRTFLFSDALTRLFTYAGIVFVVDRLRAAYARLDDLAHNDSLTGIANLRGFRNLAQREIDRAQRLAAPLTLVHIDIDGFKAVNDTRGHAEGDRLLKLVAEVLSSGRALDIAARVGGDEFVLLLPETARPDAEVAVARVRKRLVEAMRADEWPVTFSMGAATFLVAPESLDHALRVADALMYDVKHGSKDAVRFAVISESTPRAPTY